MKYKYFKKSLSVLLTLVMIFGMIGTPQSPGVLVEEVEASATQSFSRIFQIDVPTSGWTEQHGTFLRGQDSVIFNVQYIPRTANVSLQIVRSNGTTTTIATSTNGFFNNIRYTAPANSIYSLRVVTNTAIFFTGPVTYTLDRNFPTYFDYELSAGTGNAFVRWLPRRVHNTPSLGYSCLINIEIHSTAGTFVNTATSGAINSWRDHGNGRATITNNAGNSHNVLVKYEANPPNIRIGSLAFAELRAVDGNFVTKVDSISYAPGFLHWINYATIYTFPLFLNETSANRRKIMTHELGHVMGLGHPPSNSFFSIMPSNPANMADHPTNHDRAGLNLFYQL
jgi:hypothetical protein